jgi:hypothetical protein
VAWWTRLTTMSKARRSTKEAPVPAGHPLLPAFELVRTQIRMFEAVVANGEGGDTEGVQMRIDGMRNVLGVFQRAVAGEKLEGPQAADFAGFLMTIVRPVIVPGDVVAGGRSPPDRLAALEARVAELEGRPGDPMYEALVPPHVRRAIEGVAPTRELPEVLKTPKGADVTGFGGVTMRSYWTEYDLGLLRALAARTELTTDRIWAVLAGRSLRSSAFSGAVSKLKKAGLVEGASSERRITAEGRKAAGPVAPLPRGAALVEFWRAKLDRAEGDILRVLYLAGARGIQREEIGEKTGRSLTSSSFDAAISELRHLGLATRGWPMGAAAVFFEGEKS